MDIITQHKYALTHKVCTMRKPVPLHIRYEKMINCTESCWLWKGHPGTHGYPQMRVGRTGNGPVWLVHRWAYQYFVGPIPAGMLVLHHCDVKMCSNPKHLYCGTAKDNARDTTARGRRAKPGTKRFAPRHGKLSDDDVRAIRQDDRAMHAIAAQYRISESHVRHIKARMRKQHVID